MPLAEKTPEQVVSGIAKLEPELLAELRRQGTSDLASSVLGAAGFTTVRKFQCFGTSEDGVRTSCALMGLKPESIEELSEIASLCATWMALKAYQSAEDKTRADNKMLGLPNHLRSSEYTAVRQAYERSLGGGEKVADSRLPGAAIIEWLERETEEGEYTAPRLSDIPSRKEMMEAAEGTSKMRYTGPGGHHHGNG